MGDIVPLELVNKKTFQVLRDYGRKTNPYYTEKLRCFSFVAIDGKYSNYSDRLQINEFLGNIDVDPKKGIYQLYGEIAGTRQRLNKLSEEQKIKIEVLEDSIKFLGVHVIRKVVDGKVDKKYKMVDSEIETDEFVARAELISKFVDKVPENVNGLVVDYVCENDSFSEIEKKAAAWIKKMFYRTDYVFARRLYTWKIGEKPTTIVYWYIIGEDNSLAREQKKISDLFGILPFSTGTEVTEITPR